MTPESQTKKTKHADRERFDMRVNRQFIEMLDDLRDLEPGETPSRAEMLRIIVEKSWKIAKKLQ
jgi:predicted ATP-grasp superfamily ATP-dependent carboligase